MSNHGAAGVSQKAGVLVDQVVTEEQREAISKLHQENVRPFFTISTIKIIAQAEF